MNHVSRPASLEMPWPSHELEIVPNCPVCGGERRVLRYSELTDCIFAIAPGAWSLYCCRDCGSGWLDPRPNATSLPRAYVGYFTHDAPPELVAIHPRGVIKRWLHDASNDYMNYRYGTNRTPATSYGKWLAWLLPPVRAAVDSTCRHVPRATASGGLLLDVGCGNGAFLRLAREMGWDAAGLDFDPEAVGQARKAGFAAILGGVDALADQSECYDVITLSHVIEHVGDPNATLGRLYRLLKPGGVLWLETPNLGSLGHHIYGRDWRGLEPPRHLVLFNAKSLSGSLSKAGFTDIRQRWNSKGAFGVLRSSSSIRRSRVAKNAGSDKELPWELLLELAEALIPSRREFLTVTAKKPAWT